MICKHYTEGETIVLPELNEIATLIAHSETEATEVNLNAYRKELEGPLQQHEEKEQILFILSGKGRIIVGDEEYAVAPDDFIYVPAETPHQTINTGEEHLSYLLLNAYLDADKKPLSESEGRYIHALSSGKHFGFGSHDTTLLLDRSETQRCEATLVNWPAGKKGPLIVHEEMEQTFFILSGSGEVTAGNETRSVGQGQVVFIPRRTPHTTEAFGENLVYLCLNTIIAPQRYGSYAEMCLALSSL